MTPALPRYAREIAYATDRLATDHLPACPTCGDLCPPEATKCECGERLMPRPHELPERRTMAAGCTCGGNGICLVCLFAEYEGEAVRAV